MSLVKGPSIRLLLTVAHLKVSLNRSYASKTCACVGLIQSAEATPEVYLNRSAKPRKAMIPSWYS